MKTLLPYSKALLTMSILACVIAVLNLIFIAIVMKSGQELTSLCALLGGADMVMVVVAYTVMKRMAITPFQKALDEFNQFLESITGKQTKANDFQAWSANLQSLFWDLSERLAREKTLIENTVDLICVIDFDGRFLSLNSAAERYLGYTKDELKGRRVSEFLSDEDADHLTSILSTPHSIKKITFDTRLRHKSGKWVDFAWAGHWSVKDDGLFCVARDVTDAKELEQLRREFTSMINHDLSAPLTSLAGLMRLLSEGTFGSLEVKGQERCLMAASELERLMRLINDLLDIERMESKNLKLQRELVAVQDIIEASISSVMTFAEIRKVKIEYEETELLCYADRRRTIQVMVNLLSNAIKFSPVDSTINIVAEDSGNCVKFMVRDRGTGISPEKATQLFKRFQQLHTDTSVPSEGFGLGLSICKFIIDAQGGDIGCNSGAGSEFWFTVDKQKVSGES